MAINLVYADPTPAGRVAVGAGQANYAQQEMTRQQALELRLAQLAQQDRQFSAQQAQRGYQFEQELASQQAGRAQEIDARLYGAELQQMGYADMRDSEAAMQTERLAADKVKQRTAAEQRIIELAKAEQMQLGVSSAKELEKARQEGTLRPGQYEQFREQWDQRYGDSLGPYPFMGGQQSPDDAMLESVRTSLQADLGDQYYEGAADAFMQLSPLEQLQFKAEIKKNNSAEQKVQRDAEIKQQAAEAKMMQDLTEQQETHQFNMIKAAEEQKQKAATDRMKFQTDTFKSLMTVKTGEDSVTGKPTFMSAAEAGKRLDEAMAEYDRRVGGGSAPAATPPQSSAPGSTRDNPVIVTHPSEIEGLPSKTYYKRPDGKIGYRK